MELSNQNKSNVLAWQCPQTLELFDVQQSVSSNNLQPITSTCPEYLAILRHDCEHILAQAVLRLYPSTKLAVGAEQESGFGYDFITDTSFSQDDLGAIEAEMLRIIQAQYKIVRHVWSIAKAQRFYQDNPVKRKVLDRLAAQGVQEVSMYEQGEMIDLCRGPHGQCTDQTPVFFKLTQLSGIQSQDGLNMQRIKGVMFATATDLEIYLENIEKAKEQDHRKLAAKMDLYHVCEHTPGCIFWKPNGWKVIERLKRYIGKLQDLQGYVQVNTPELIDISLWQRSGHWDKFSENMFKIENDGQTFALKPMSCPAHVEIFKSTWLGGVKSYNMLPLRIAEFGQVFRNEATGALQGLKRLRKFTQDDGHIFCTPDQISEEIKLYCVLFKTVYKAFGFEQYSVELSTRPANRLGDDKTWDMAESALAEGAHQADMEYKIAPGEGAFYGPKLDFSVLDCMGRKWQCCTVQLDFQLPVKLDAEYIDAAGDRQHPVMIHRAVYGSIERFLGLVLENTNGYLPHWCAPIQCVVVSLLDDDHYVRDIVEQLRDANVDVLWDKSNHKLGYKIREHTIARVENLMIIGKKEAANGQVTLANLRTKEQSVYNAAEAVELLRNLARIPDELLA